MPKMTIGEFADQVNEIMPAIMRMFLKKETSEFCKMKITLPQFVVLDILVRNGESRMTDLARAISVTTAAVTGIVDRLVRDGYVKRGADAKDRRAINVKPTGKGMKTVKSAIEHRKDVTEKMFGAVSDRDRAEYLRILNLIKDNMADPGR